MPRHLSCAGLTAVALLATAAWADDLEASGEPKIYVGDEGVRVTVLALAPRDAQRVLVKVDGSDTELDGKVRLHAVSDTGRGADFTYRSGSKMWVTLTSRDSRWSWRRFELYLPKRKESVRLFYDEGASKAADANELLGKYLRRRPPAALKGPKQDRISADEGTLAAAVSSANAACKTQLSAHIDWKTVPDDLAHEVDVGARCADVLRAMALVCADDVGKEAVSKRLKTVACQVGAKSGLTVSGSQARWTVVRNEPDDVDSAQDALERAL